MAEGATQALASWKWWLAVIAIICQVTAILAMAVRTFVIEPKIEAIKAPRKLSDGQRQRLISALAASQGPKGLIGFRCVIGDAEGNPYGRQIEAAVKAGSWPTTPFEQTAYAGENPIGFGLQVQSIANPPPHAAAVRAAFWEAGLKVGVMEKADVPTDVVRVLIGNKP